jgi:hypothetical protein
MDGSKWHRDQSASGGKPGLDSQRTADRAERFQRKAPVRGDIRAGAEGWASLSNAAKAKIIFRSIMGPRGDNNMLALTPPKHVTLYISVAIAIIAIIIHYAEIDIPHVHSGFVILLIGYLVLLAGNLLKGL